MKSFVCFLGALACWLAGGGRLIFGERMSVLESFWTNFCWELSYGESFPRFLMESKIFLFRLGNSYYGFTVERDGNGFLCYFAVALVIIGVFCLLGSKTKSLDYDETSP